MKLFINLTPCVPLSMIGISSLHEGEKILERGFAPLLPTLPLPLMQSSVSSLQSAVFSQVRGIGW